MATTAGPPISPQPPHPSGTVEGAGWGVVLPLLLLLGLVARLIGLGDQGLWVDEAYSVVLGLSPVHRIIAETAVDNHPPLYYILLHVWAAAFGASVVSLRMLSVLLGVATVGVGADLARRLSGNRGGLAAGLLLSLSPFLVYYSHEIRQYALLGLLCLVATEGLVVFLQATDPARAHRGALLFAGASAAALYSMYVAGLVFAGHLAGAAIVLGRKRGAERRRGLVLLGSAAAGTVLAFLPWVPVLVRQIRGLGSILEPHNSVLKLPATLLVWLGGYTQTRHAFYSRSPGELLLLAAGALLATYLCVAITRDVIHGRNGRPHAALLVPIIAPPIALWLVSVVKPMYLTYCLLPSGALFLVVAGLAFAGRRAPARVAGLGLCGLVFFASLGLYWSSPDFGRGQTMLELAQWMRHNVGRGDTVYFDNEWLYLPTEAYLRMWRQPLRCEVRLLEDPHVAPQSRMWPPRAGLPFGQAGAGSTPAVGRRALVVRGEGEEDVPGASPLATFGGSHQNPGVVVSVIRGRASALAAHRQAGPASPGRRQAN